MTRWGFGPVFFLECVSAARRWQMYASRVILLALLLASLVIVWMAELAFGPDTLSISALARVGEAFFYAIVGTQLVLVLLAAPAHTAGAVCLDKTSGRLTHMLVTDLSATEIVLGKLGPRLLSVLGLLLASLPILALSTMLGGIVPETLFGAFLVTLGLAVVTCTVAMLLSVWGNHPHEVLLTTYVIVAVPTLIWPAWELVPTTWGLGPVPDWIEKSNPFWLAFAPYLRPGSISIDDHVAFLGVCLGLSVVLTLLAAATLRRASARVAVNRPLRKRRRLFRWWFPRSGPLSEFDDRMIRELHRRRLPLSLRVFWVLYYILLGWWRVPRSTIKREMLHLNPVLWREWGRRPSRWMRLGWILYSALSLLATIVALNARGSTWGGELPGIVAGLQYTLGLFLVSITAATSLFEERVRGHLDILLTTPIPTGSIVGGKWVASFRDAVLVMAVPLGTAFWLNGNGDCVFQLVVMMLVYGAAATSLGLALATWVKRPGMALALTAVVIVLVAVVPILIDFSLQRGLFYRGDSDYFYISPWYSIGELIDENKDTRLRDLGWKITWLFFYGCAAWALVFATRITYDRCMGRVKQVPGTLDNEQFLREIGVRISHLRRARRWTQMQLAERCGLTCEYIQSIERGDPDASHVNLRRIAKVLRIPLAKLFERLT